MQWHRRAKHAFAHSLRVRLVAMFLLLAFAMAAAFLFGMQAALGTGWRDAAKPLVTDYVDKLAADIGSPPSIERAQALTAAPAIERATSAARKSTGAATRKTPTTADGWMDDKRSGPEELRFYERTTADGHRIQFGVSVKAWARPAPLHRLGHAGHAAAAHLAGLHPRAPHAAAAGRYSRRCPALWGG